MLSQVLINVVCLRFAAVAETCDHDLNSALQTHSQAVRHSVADESFSQVDRVFEAIRNTASDAEVICVSAQAGEEAPFPGTFTPASGHKVEVGAGQTASESGEYCVQNSLVSLMQRATIDGQAGNFEAVMAGKGKDKSTSGKNSRRRRRKCGGASDHCRSSLKLRNETEVAQACGSKRNEEVLEERLPWMGCKDVAQIDAVCKSDCTMTCAEVLKGIKAQMIVNKKLTEELLLKHPDIHMPAMKTWPDAACCNTAASGLCENFSAREGQEGMPGLGGHTPRDMTQDEVWKMIADSNNKYYEMTDKCTAQMIEDSC